MKVKNITQSCHEVEEAVFSVQGSSKYRNKLKNDQDDQKKISSYPRNTNDILCCHDIEGAVFRVHI